MRITATARNQTYPDLEIRAAILEDIGRIFERNIPNLEPKGSQRSAELRYLICTRVLLTHISQYG
jgi:hypothetical protein